MNNDYNNGYNNQSPSDGNRPDYTYNWNGSEHRRNDRRGGAKHYAVVAVIVLLIAALAVTAIIGYRSAADRFVSGTASESSGDNSESSRSAGANSGSELVADTSRTNYSDPEFVPRTDVEKVPGTLTEIYEQASVSCCTIKATTNTGYSIGSGFVIDSENGYIATNHHVINGQKSITVTFYDGTSYDAELIGSDATTDLAVLHIEADGLKALPIGNSQDLKIGEQVMAIGTPYSEMLAGTMTVGYISGITRDFKITNAYGKTVKVMTLIQTDCPINPGNSGGPLIDMAGNVVGINSLKIMSEEYEGLGFAIPITEATEIFTKLIKGEEITSSGIASASPYLGINVYDLEAGLSYYRISPKCEYPSGVLVASISSADSAVYKAGLAFFDIITEFNGKAVDTASGLVDELNKYKAGDEVTLTVFRFNRGLTSGEYLTLTFKLDAVGS